MRFMKFKAIQNTVPPPLYTLVKVLLQYVNVSKACLKKCTILARFAELHYIGRL